MERPLLNDPAVYPSDDILSATLKAAYPAFKEMETMVLDAGLTMEWRYYNDGKAWLCKVCLKKKTIFWISAWAGFFIAGFYFTEKHVEDIMGLDIDEELKRSFAIAKPIGKLLPLIINIYDEAPLKDLLAVMQFKKQLK